MRLADYTTVGLGGPARGFVRAWARKKSSSGRCGPPTRLASQC